LIVSIKTAVIDYKAQSPEDQVDLYKAIEIIVLSQEVCLSNNDLCSTFYMFDEVEEFDVYKNMKDKLFSAPFALRDLAKIEVRRNLKVFDSENVEQLKGLSEPMQKFLFFETN